MEQEQPAVSRTKIVAGVAGGAVLLGVTVWLIHGLMAGKSQKSERLVQNITVIRPPPPPPPEQAPPPPPPDKLNEPIQQDQPEPSPDNAPSPSQQLGLDADGAAGEDGFGLAAHRGGGDLVGGSGAVFAWYTGKLKDVVSDRLSADSRLRGRKFAIGVRIWIETDGRIKDVKLTSGTGNRELDGAIASALVALGRMNESPPIEMPQPISLQIVSRS